MFQKKYFIQEVCTNNFSAGSKARKDCDIILKSSGYTSLPIADRSISNIFIKVLSLLKILLLLFLSKKQCFIQYPLYSFTKYPISYRLFLGFFLGQLDVLIHDIDGLRNEGKKDIEPELNYLLKKSNKIIVHTTKMKEILIEKLNLESSKIHVLYLFDYLTDKRPYKADISGNTIIFAGNLAKSLFISKLNTLPKNIQFNIYGVFHENVKESSNCLYKGKFNPDNITAIEGNWGLVWDGDMLETCHDRYGEYLKINSSHKISLYISACKPIIIWKEASISNFIVNNYLGIAVNSLYEIPECLASLTNEQKLKIEASVNKYSEKVRNGEMLKAYI